MPQARILRSAIRDLDAIWLYIARDNIDAAEKLMKKIQSAAEKLAQMPGMGQRRDDFSPGLRSFPVGNYLIFYKRIRGGIEVLHVYHGAQNLYEFFKKETD
jgi:toxin ParE1/3/4